MMHTANATALAGALALFCAAGCSHGHEHRRTTATATTGTSGDIFKAQDEAADMIIAHARRYIDAREKTPGRPGAKGPIEAQDLALETLLEAGSALEVASRAEQVADDVDTDKGRAARVKNGATLLRRAAHVAVNQSKETLRTGDDVALKGDVLFLRALLRSLKVDLLALQREVNE
jgi:hypothetical protein